jgi:hypothetical protein
MAERVALVMSATRPRLFTAATRCRSTRLMGERIPAEKLTYGNK